VVAWLLTIARNVSINMLPARRVDAIDPEVIAAMEHAGQRDEGPETRVTDSDVMRQALAHLPENQRRVLVLAVVYGFTAREVSEMDGVPLGTVKTRIRSAMTKLRSELGVQDDR
jgi:RNA polymerase sigma factor (sigma-70 family)